MNILSLAQETVVQVWPENVSPTARRPAPIARRWAPTDGHKQSTTVCMPRFDAPRKGRRMLARTPRVTAAGTAPLFGNAKTQSLV
jgi:hypothetical protein